MQTIKILKKLERETLAEIYYSGSFVREIIRRKSPKDIEIVVRNLQLKDLVGYFKKYGAVLETDNKSYLIFQPRENNNKIKISLPNRNGRYNPYFTLYDDAHSRDFTINAMFLPITSKIKKNLIDYFDGLSDIRSRKIRTTKNAKQSVRKHPLRMLKAVSLSAEIGYKIDSNLFYSIKSNYLLISKLLRSKVRDELIKILLSDKPSKYIKILHKLNLLNEIIPELVICMGVTQNEKYHKYDVFNHCVYACDNTKPDLVLRIAALFHDIGKPQTREEKVDKNGNIKVTFYNHEVVSSKLAKRILKRLRFENKIISEITELIYLHMYNYEPKEWTEAAVRRFIKKAKITNKELGDLSNLPIFLLRRADRLSNGRLLKAVSYRQRMFEKEIEEVYNKSKVLDIKDLSIDGSAIMDKFNLKPGPTIGHILNYLLSIVIEDQKMNTEELLINAASDYLSKALE